MPCPLLALCLSYNYNSNQRKSRDGTVPRTATATKTGNGMARGRHAYTLKKNDVPQRRWRRGMLWTQGIKSELWAMKALLWRALNRQVKIPYSRSQPLFRGSCTCAQFVHSKQTCHKRNQWLQKKRSYSEFYLCLNNLSFSASSLDLNYQSFPSSNMRFAIPSVALLFPILSHIVTCIRDFSSAPWLSNMI